VEAGTECPVDGKGIAFPGMVADRLARFLWKIPVATDDLVARLPSVSSAKVREVAAWMLTDARARDGISAFIRSWLRLDDLASIPKPAGVLSAELTASMQKEAPAFALSAILDGDAKYETLMLAPYTFADETLARHYGIAGVTGPEMRRVPYNAPDRAGVLTGAGVLTRFSGSLDPPWPPRRFWLTYETMLCDASALPPAVPKSNRFDPDVTIREDLETSTSHSPCNACHVTVNPIGNVFDRFDSFGRYKTVDEKGVSIDTAEVIPAGLTVKTGLTVSDSTDLIRQLAKRFEVRRCFSARLLEYALNPVPQPTGSAIDMLPAVLQCDLTQVHAAFESSGGDIRELIFAIVTSRAFLKAP
jgi:hypothetical protein